MVYGQKPKYYSSIEETMVVHAAKYPNVIPISKDSKAEGKGSSTRSKSGYRQEKKGGNPVYL